jgi:hypothetical protein
MKLTHKKAGRTTGKTNDNTGCNVRFMKDSANVRGQTDISRYGWYGYSSLVAENPHGDQRGMLKHAMDE